MIHDPLAHSECVEFIRAALAQDDAEFAQQMAAIVREVCDAGHADRAQIWAELSADERARFSELMTASSQHKTHATD